MTITSRTLHAPNGAKVSTRANKTYIIVTSGTDETVGNFAHVSIRTDNLKTALAFLARHRGDPHAHTLFRKTDGKRAIGTRTVIVSGSSATEIVWE